MGSIMHINVYTPVVFIICIIIANSCANDQITDIGRMDVYFNGKSAFRHAYIHLHDENTDGNDKIFLRQYFVDLFNEVISICDDLKLENPMDWCLNNISNPFVEEENKKIACEIYLKVAAIDIDWDTRETLHYMYFKLSSKLIMRTNEVVKQYFQYMLEKILPHVDKKNAAGPRLYCDKFNLPVDFTTFYIDYYQLDPYAVKRKVYSYTDCIIGIEEIGEIIDSNGVDAFENAYLKLNSLNTKFYRNDILRQYLNDLFATGTVNYEDNILENPTTWCIRIKNIRKFDPVKIHKKCGFLRQEDFNGDAKKALKYAYFKMVETKMNMNKLLRAYYMYMIDTLKPHLYRSYALGPKQYCKQTSIENTSANDQSHTADPNQSSDDRNKPESSGAKVPYNYLNFNQSLESTYVMGQDTVASGQPGCGLYQSIINDAGGVKNDPHFDSYADVRSPKCFSNDLNVGYSP